MSGHSWAFEQLAPSPGTTPANGPARDRSDLTLSFPCDPDALQAQLEQWTTVAFDFDSPPADAGPALDTQHAQPLVPSSPGLPHARVGEFGFSQHYANKLGASLAAEQPQPQPSTVAPAEFTSTVDLSALLGGANNGDAAFAGSLVDPALSLPSFVEPSLPSFVVPQTPAGAPAATLSPAEASTSAAHTPASTVTSRKGNGAAKKKRTSTTSAAAKAAAAKEAAAAAAAAEAAALTANVGGRSLPLPEGIDTTGMTDEELNRLAIEEDRRRRNTAASARFRVKKKQREQALEQTAKELKERVAVLEKEVETLRTENGWLRSLVVDKSVSTAPGGAANNRKRKIEDVESTTAAIEGGLSSSSLLV
uniref:BY PROTMAP: gi/472588450/gb/EMS25922.1/ regulatory protein cys-3, transcription factor [Rhodosporidium toruloides NP11] gi/647396242/emb/CDR38266.1/ RHTO0S03e07140g1_1 [Rhodosporidium toruloides] n=1 Tax=Rhodotorula toruloides TaxID=5286 RepID=A0A0K3C7V3_RHOTO